LWNVAAFYLFVVKLEPWIAAVVVVGLIALTFAPFRFIHPLRVANLRAANLAALGAWSVLALYALYRHLDPGPWVAWALSAIAIYFLGVGFARPRR
jgi:phosphatidylcholine synthase